MVLSWWPKLASLVALCGDDEAVRLGRASEAAIDELRVFCEAHEIDVRLPPGRAAVDRDDAGPDRRVGRGGGAHRAPRRRRVRAARDRPRWPAAAGSPAHLAGVFERRAATVQPAALARGLAARRARARASGSSRTRELTGFTRERPLAIRTDGGGLLAAEKLIIAMNAWAAELPELRRSLVVVSSDIVATAPIPDRLSEIGWNGGEGITDSQMMVNYYRTTRDGRIAFGKGTAGAVLPGPNLRGLRPQWPGAARRSQPSSAALPESRRRPDRAGLGRTDRPDHEQRPDPRPPRRPRAHPLRSRLERQRRWAERARREGAGQPGAWAAATSGPRHG